MIGPYTGADLQICGIGRANAKPITARSSYGRMTGFALLILFHGSRAHAKAGITSAANSSTERIASSWVIVPNAKSQMK